MANKDKEIVTLNVEDIIPYSGNPKKHPEEQVNKIASAIKNYGYDQNIVVDENNEIIKGHGRLKAIKKLGWDEVEVTKRYGLTDAEKKGARISDNKTSESEYNDEELAQQIEEIKDSDHYEDYLDTVDEQETAEYLDSLTDEEDLEEPESEDPEQVETDIQEGDVFKLGRHRLMCGDATKEEHVNTLMDGEKADLLLTDPPYGIGESNEKNLSRGDKAEPTNYGHYEWDEERIDSAGIENGLNKTAEQLIFGGNYYTDILPPSSCWIVWDKNNGDTDFADAELLWGSFSSACRITEFTWHGMIREGDEERVHPTQKPVKLIARILNKYVDDSKTILDLFGGSGSTLLASEQTNRKCFMMELDPQYCQVIINRWEELTGKKAEPIKT